MNYILTKHSRQRRIHYDILEKEYLLNFLHLFSKVFDFNNLSEDIYKIYSGGDVAIVKKEKNNLILITFRGFKKEKHNNIEWLKENLKIRISNRNNKKIYISNNENKKQICIGFFENKNIEKTIIFKQKFLERNNIKIPNRFIFNNLEDIERIFNYKEEDNKLIISFF